MRSTGWKTLHVVLSTSLLPLVLIIRAKQQGATSVQVKVNGNLQEITAGMTIAAILQHLGLDSKFLAVERNRQLVPRRDHAACQLEQGDEIEIVTLVGGG